MSVSTEYEALNWRRLCSAMNEEKALVLIDDGTKDGRRVECMFELEDLLRRLAETDYATIDSPPEAYPDYDEPFEYGSHDARGDGPRNYLAPSER